MNIGHRANPALDGFARPQRKVLLKNEARRRKSGAWGTWERIEVEPGDLTESDGWTAEVRVVFRNDVFAVLTRLAFGGVVHFAVSSLTGIRPSWHEMQRIKDELAGPEKTAVEVYPPKDEIVDGSDMFHIWVLPGKLPFGLFTDGKTSGVGRNDD